MDIHDFIMRQANVLDLGEGFTLGRESCRNMDFMTITHNGETLFSWWHNPKKKISKNQPKHTGGKPSYVKLMIEGLKRHSEISNDAIALIVKISANVQWTTNLIINKRSKKPLNGEDISKVVGMSKSKTYDVMKELIQSGLLEKNKEGYRLSTELIQKGGGKIENRKAEGI